MRSKLSGKLFHQLIHILKTFINFYANRTSLGIQWLRLAIPNARGAGSIPDQETKIPYNLWPKNQNINSMKTLKMVHIKKQKKKS